MTGLFRLFGGQISAGTATKLNDKRLLRLASGLDSVSVVKEQLERVRSKRHIAKTDDVIFNRMNFRFLLFTETKNGTEMHIQFGFIFEIESAFAFVLLNLSGSPVEENTSKLPKQWMRKREFGNSVTGWRKSSNSVRTASGLTGLMI
jgi:hypothetical protein